MTDSRKINETDVREEIAAPLLSILGYRRGTENDILREHRLSYDCFFLGRKKADDPPLRGKADYVLSVLGAGRWVLETKAPSENITRDDIEQAISYGRHPEVCATYIAVLDGNQFLLFHNSQNSSDAPRLSLPVSTPEKLAEQLEGILSPAAIARDCKPPIIDLEKPLCSGLRSSVQMTGGIIFRSAVEWRSAQELPIEIANNLNEAFRRLTELKTGIIGGRVYRDTSGGIRATISWDAPHDELLNFIKRTGFNEVEYISLGQTISNDPDHPTVFDMKHVVEVKKGESLFDFVAWKTNQAAASVNVEIRGQASGYITEGVFHGSFQMEQVTTLPQAPSFRLETYILGNFNINLDLRLVFPRFTRQKLMSINELGGSYEGNEIHGRV